MEERQDPGLKDECDTCLRNVIGNCPVNNNPNKLGCDYTRVIHILKED